MVFTEEHWEEAGAHPGQDSLLHTEVGNVWFGVVVLFLPIGAQCSIVHWTPLAQEGSRSPCCNNQPGTVKNKVWVSSAHELLTGWEKDLLSGSDKRGNNIWWKNCICLIGTASPTAAQVPVSEVSLERYDLLQQILVFKTCLRTGRGQSSDHQISALKACFHKMCRRTKSSCFRFVQDFSAVLVDS